MPPPSITKPATDLGFAGLPWPGILSLARDFLREAVAWPGGRAWRRGGGPPAAPAAAAGALGRFFTAAMAALDFLMMMAARCSCVSEAAHVAQSANASLETRATPPVTSECGIMRPHWSQ